MFVQRVDPKTGKKKWALISRKTRRVLQWFNKKPSEDEKGKAERRVQYFKALGAK